MSDDFIGDDDISRAIASGDPFGDGDRIDVPIVSNNGAWVDIAQRRLPSGVAGVPDDFSQLLQDRYDAQNMPGVGPVDDLATETRYRAIVAARSASQAMPVNPRSANFRNAVGGAVATVSSGAQSAPVVWFQGDDEEMQLWTVTIQPIPRTNTYPISGQSFRPFGSIVFGTRVAPITIEVDPGTYTVGGSAVFVSVGMRAAPSGLTAGTLDIAAYLAAGARQSSSSATVTSYIDGLASSTNATAIVIPPLAKALLPVQMEDGAGTGQVRLSFRNTSGTVVSRLDISSPGGMISPLPLAPDFFDVIVRNTGANTEEIRLCWELAL